MKPIYELFIIMAIATIMIFILVLLDIIETNIEMLIIFFGTVIIVMQSGHEIETRKNETT